MLLHLILVSACYALQEYRFHMLNSMPDIRVDIHNTSLQSEIMLWGKVKGNHVATLRMVGKSLFLSGQAVFHLNTVQGKVRKVSLLKNPLAYSPAQDVSDISTIQVPYLDSSIDVLIKPMDRDSMCVRTMEMLVAIPEADRSQVTKTLGESKLHQVTRHFSPVLKSGRSRFDWRQEFGNLLFARGVIVSNILFYETAPYVELYTFEDNQWKMHLGCSALKIDQVSNIALVHNPDNLSEEEIISSIEVHPRVNFIEIPLKDVDPKLTVSMAPVLQNFVPHLRNFSVISMLYMTNNFNNIGSFVVEPHKFTWTSKMNHTMAKVLSLGNHLFYDLHAQVEAYTNDGDIWSAVRDYISLNAHGVKQVALVYNPLKVASSEVIKSLHSPSGTLIPLDTVKIFMAPSEISDPFKEKSLVPLMRTIPTDSLMPWIVFGKMNALMHNNTHRREYKVRADSPYFIWRDQNTNELVGQFMIIANWIFFETAKNIDIWIFRNNEWHPNHTLHLNGAQDIAKVALVINPLHLSENDILDALVFKNNKVEFYMVDVNIPNMNVDLVHLLKMIPHDAVSTITSYEHLGNSFTHGATSFTWPLKAQILLLGNAIFFEKAPEVEIFTLKDGEWTHHPRQLSMLSEGVEQICLVDNRYEMPLDTVKANVGQPKSRVFEKYYLHLTPTV